MKDLFDENGNFITEEILQEKLNNKNNWISEFFMIKNVVYKNIRKHFDKVGSEILWTNWYEGVCTPGEVQSGLEVSRFAI